MFGTAKMSSAAAAAFGLVALAALAGCEGEQSVASKSAAAFREAQKKGETFEGAEHSHGHGAVTPGGTHAEPGAAMEEEHPAGHDHGTAEAPAAGGGQEGHGHGAHAGAPAPRSGRSEHGAHGTTGAEPHGGSHAGHGTTPPQAPAAGTQPQPSGTGPTGHAGHAPSPGGVPPAAAAPAPAAPSPGQPAETLRPDALDAPAASSVLDAQRSAEMAQGMAGGHGGHGGHGSGTYRHVDVGREPGAAPATPAPSSHEGEHKHTSGVAESTDVVYVCPMHPEVTSETPGTCPKCGMTLVERRKG